MSPWTGGAERYHTARRLGYEDQAVGIPDDQKEWFDMMAGAAEDLVAQRTGGRLVEKAGQAARKDVVLPDGRVIDVKWTQYSLGRLIRYLNNKGEADIYVLVTGRSVDRLKIRGWAPAERLLSNIIDLGYGPVYGLSQIDLEPGISFMGGRLP